MGEIEAVIQRLGFTYLRYTMTSGSGTSSSPSIWPCLVATVCGRPRRPTPAWRVPGRSGYFSMHSLRAHDEDYLDQIVAAFGIDRDLVITHQWVDNGLGWAVVQLAKAEGVSSARTDLTLIPTAMVAAIGARPANATHTQVRDAGLLAFDLPSVAR
jgi:hypothetical protein